MPIYMDRHDIPESITAEHVAKMHREDLKIEHLYNCKGMTYWCDEKRRTAFCLIKAPNKKAIQDMHNHAHGDVPHRIIEVDGSIVESFLGRIEDPKKSQNTTLNIINDPAFRTIMVIRLHVLKFNSELPKQFHQKIKRYNKSILTSIAKYEGRMVKQKNDYSLLSFTSVSQAVHCAQEIYIQFKALVITAGTDLQVSIGLHVGIPVTEKESIFEDTIKLAERFCALIQDKVILSQEVWELYESENLNVKLTQKYLKALTMGDEKLVDRIMDYTEKEWHNTTFNSYSFSKTLGFSKSQLYRKMRALSGRSPNGFIKEYRLNRALELLRKNNKNISETAFTTGFNSPAYFTKCFMDRFGILPSKYIQNYSV